MAEAQSTCYGTPLRGRLENGVRLPAEGSNFAVYSLMGMALGRTYVHQAVRDIVVAAYEATRLSAPGRVFVYGETGRRDGGPFPPHPSHQNGLSVDFMVPVLDSAGRSVPLPTPAGLRFGYDTEFDDDARVGGLRIDFEAMAEHLFQLHLAALAHPAAGIDRVIFTPVFLPKLFATARGPYLKKHLSFMRREAWVRHDEHYQVDFSLPCLPMATR